MDNIFADATFWQIVGYLLGAALTLLVIVLTARYTTLWSARTVTEVRVILNQVQRQLDEPDDHSSNCSTAISPARPTRYWYRCCQRCSARQRKRWSGSSRCVR